MTTGVFYVATGEYYGKLANASIASMRSIEDCPVTVFCEDSARAQIGDYDNVSFVNIPNPQFDWNDKLYGFENTPYEKSVYLDSDILVVRRFLDDLATALDYNGLILRSDGVGFNYDWERDNYPVAIPQFNTGVVAFRRSSLNATISRWRELCKERPGIPDQPTFRAAVIETGVAASELPADFNCLPNGNLVNEVRLLHCIKKKHLMSSDRKARRAIANAASIALPAVLVRDHAILSGNRPSIASMARLSLLEIYDLVRRGRKWIKYEVLGFQRRKPKQS